jgi:hypothetical protein
VEVISEEDGFLKDKQKPYKRKIYIRSELCGVHL